MLNIAIDGPSGAGKSSVAKAVAKNKGILYLDTGALYRAIGLYVLRKGLDTKSSAEVAPLLDEIHISLRFVDGVQRVILCGEDVTDTIRTQPVAMAASDVSALREVRSFLLSLQRDIAAKNDCIMDGRDIGTVILPNADLKIFLTASTEARAHRRCSELAAKGIKADFDSVYKEIAERDSNDSSREIAPLKAADDAVTVDTTNMELDEVVGLISRMIGELV